MTPQRLGQHFLTDAGWRARIIERLAPNAGQVWVEIGAGRGEMTRELARRTGNVVAIELDPALADKLRESTKGLPVEIVRGDILSLDLVKLAGPRFRVYGSLPYYITSPILRKLFAIADHLDEIDVVIQWEVARRVAAQPGSRDFGWLSVLAQFYTRPEILQKIPPGAFRPPPKVDSALVRLVPPGENARLKLEDEKGFLEFAQKCFGQKRKTLANNLKAGYQAEALREAIGALGRGMQVRAEQLGIAEMAGLFRMLESGKRESA
ncbi:MAG TPA: 16S rRNA (adenine(1518)-N(6)/adenine(1519)-N(6))-dimethyltransferase RsmA [Patescibacteria group bacterium]|nr:16S rRNA (adenine(1518)-N(6)/adenine(1519)-N(6))-dimethyltransferase RsmA [Patescibacteria group bacterium]